jgi:uncharacterized protein YndB with AHSA1/START domain
MRTLVPRDLAWIEQAPLSIEGRTASTASPQQVFDVLADHERWPEWFPNVKAVEVIGPAAGVGARRRVRVPGAVVEEEFIAWDPGIRWSFTGTAARPGFVRSLVEDCRLDPTPDGGTTISYTMHLDPARGYGPLVRLSAGRIRTSIQKAVEQLAARAAG